MLVRCTMQSKQVIKGIIYNTNRRSRMRGFCSTSNTETFLSHDEEMESKRLREEKIEKARNKSNLQQYHFNMLHRIVPYDEKTLEQKSLRVKRQMYGRFGELSKINKSVLWPSKEELKAVKEYEAVAHPHSVNELITQVKEQSRKEEEARIEREKQVLEKIKISKIKVKMFKDKVRQRHLQALAAIEEKKRKIFEIQTKVGYDISTKSDQFKQLFREMEEEEHKKKIADKKMAKAKKKTLLAETSTKQETISKNPVQEGAVNLHQEKEF